MQSVQGGGFTLKLEERGTFSRNFAGDEATHLKVIRDGQATPGSSEIRQRKEGLSHVIDDARQQYRVLPWPESKALTNEAERQSTPAVTRTIDGIKCVAVPVRDNTGKIVGKDWVSPDHGITVRSEMDVLSPQTGAVIGLWSRNSRRFISEQRPIQGRSPFQEDTSEWAAAVPVEEAIIAEWVWEPIEAQGMCWERSLTPASLSRRYT